MHFDLIGKIVRRMDADVDRVVYGIQLLTRSQSLNRYINVRQSEQIENERSYRDLKKELVNTMKTYAEKEDE
jgi:hypothetical protein